METKKLYPFLKNKGFLIEQPIADVIETAIIGLPGIKAFLLAGRPGTGKTTLTELIAEWLRAEYIYFLATPNTDEDALLYKFVPDESSKSGIRIAEGPVTQAIKRSIQGKVVLVIDEFDKTRPSADALLLDLLQHGRITLYLGGREDVLVASPQNLFVFLTSNGVREFSEPLMRRLIKVDFQLLSQSDIYELLKRHFDAPIAKLLAEIYAATVMANLRKPATLQELVQLGHVLMKALHVPLEMLVKMFIVKYDDDWENFRRSLDHLNDLWREATQYVQKQQEHVDSDAEAQQTYTDGATEDAKVYTFKAPFTDDMRAAIAELDISKFKVINVDGDRAIVAEKPLSIEEYLRLYDDVRTYDGFEAYVEDKVPLVSYDIEELARNADSVKTHGRYVVIVGKTNTFIDHVVAAEEEVHIELPETEFGEAVIKAYAKAAQMPSYKKRPRSPILCELQLLRRNLCFKRLKHTESLASTVAGVVSMCLEEPIGLIIDGEMGNSDVEKIERALVERGVELEKECRGGKYVRIAVRKTYSGKVQISCYK
jgi:adenylate kinase family enzyme